MIYLSGAITRAPLEGVGHMLQPNMGNLVPAEGWWALDNGCFSKAREFDIDRFLSYANKTLAAAGDRCLFVVCPDVAFDAAGTIARWHEYQDRIRQLGRPVAFVTQDGMGMEDVPWEDIDALFVGGSTEWKLGHESGALMAEAKRRGMWVHVGRVNSLRRFRHAYSLGADSCDGTFLKYAPDINRLRMADWFRQMREEPVMTLAHREGLGPSHQA